MNSKQCFPPVVNENTTLLILGSLPGDRSLAQGEYYANKQNSFWYLMSQLLRTDLVHLNYQDRLATLLGNGVGLWDVVADAMRDGSLDSRIKEHRSNDLLGLIATLPKLKAVAFNGKTAARLGQKQLVFAREAITTIELPSSSPAYTLAVHKKVDRWQELQPFLSTEITVE
ncbi:DNA-deoxyinosine glycosylase [Duganella sp. FT109W]|uniref:DNA-deoxyinosine glycosylase n=1 Tax=Duganella margarita TaxID=2692170 RepID=A0ABW9WG37_9BURK|nr:DNA-deoxyinosine glycosylase [Duganella margarita]MYN39185.1 DNA-deoxyinosine glycosylase [Duganella margarita]